MSAISYVIGVDPNLESLTTGVNAPSSKTVELRIDTTSNAVTDSNSPTGTRAPKKGEILALLSILEQQVLRDTNIPQ
jgi:hypothetical protein